MDQVKKIMETQLTERELMIYLIIENGGMSMRSLATSLMTNHTSVRRTYEAAQEKMSTFAEAGMFSTPVPKKD